MALFIVFAVAVVLVGAFIGGAACALKLITKEPVLLQALEYEWTRLKIDRLIEEGRRQVQRTASVEGEPNDRRRWDQ
jgi:uncharacterized membrane protein